MGGFFSGCCSQSKSLASTLGQCSWTACGGSCPSSSTLLTTTLTGDGGDSPCPSGRRSLCCPTSGSSGFIASTCGWYRNAFHNTCTPGCPQGKVQLAVDSAGANCVRGYGSFCCDAPVNLLAGRGDPQVMDFQRLVHAFITTGTCTAGHGVFRHKRQLGGFTSLHPSSHDMAVRLAPMLYDWVWSRSERRYIVPFQQAWDDERSADGDLVLPTFDELASLMAQHNFADSSAVDYVDDELCNGAAITVTVDPLVCSLATCGGGVCAAGKRWMATVPDDVSVVGFDTSGARIGTDFTDPSIDNPEVWWQQAKNLDWWQGSNHGVDAAGQERASSAFVDFNNNPGQNIFTGAGPVWGCTAVAIVTNRGAWTAHFWQNFFTNDALFQANVLDFLESGSIWEPYPGLNDLVQPGGPFDLPQTTFLYILIMTPKAYTLTPSPAGRPQLVQGTGPLYPARIAQIEQKLNQIFGVTNLNIPRYLYNSDQGIWNWVRTTTTVGTSTHVHWTWRLDRQDRLVQMPWVGMLTIQRRATNVPSMRAEVRVYAEDDRVFSQAW